MMQKPPLQSSTSLMLMYIASFLLCAVFGALLIQIGTPGNYINLMMLALLVGGYVFAGMFGKTMLLPVFQTAVRTGSPFYIGQSLASGLLSSTVFILLAGEFYQNGTDALTIFSGLILGVALMTILFAAPINRSKSTTLAGLIEGQKLSKLNRVLMLFITVICSLLLLYVQLSAIGYISQSFFDIPSQAGILLTAFAIGFCLIMGGIQSLSIIRMLAYPILAITFLAPLIWVTYKITGNPIPQLSFGAGALQAISEIDREMLNAGFAQKEDIFEITKDGLNYDTFNHLAALLSIAFGTAAMPHLLQHFKTLPKASHARKTGVWALGFLLLILTAIPAVAAFVKLDIYTTLLGLRISDLEQEAAWLFSLSDQNGVAFITICGKLIANSAQAIAACGETTEYFLSTKDIGLNADMLLLTSAALSALPDLMTTLLAIGALFALWSTADGLILVMANTLTEDGYRGVIRPKSPMGSRLFMSRLFIVLLIAISTYGVFYLHIDTRFAFAACFALLTASIFPFLVSQFWLKNLSKNDISLGVVVGFIITTTMLLLSHYGYDFIARNGDEIELQIPMITQEIKPLSTGLIGMIFTFIIAFASSKFSKLSLKTNKVQSDVPT